MFIGKYSSIENHYKSVGDMLGLPAVASEKIDGSNFSVHIKVDGDYEFRSRNQKANDAEGSLFHEACLLVEEKIPELREYLCNGLNDVVAYFEVFGRGVQKRINYDKTLEECPRVYRGRSVALIDIATLPTKEDGKRGWWAPKVIHMMAGILGFYTPKQITYEKLTMAHVEDMLSQKDIEGWVVKTVDEDGFTVRNHYGDRKLVKVKTDWFTSYENKGPREQKAKPRTPPEIIEFVMDRVNFGRLHSVYSHGHEDLKKEMSDMRFLPTIVLEDIRGETADHEIWTQFEDKAIRKVIAHMLPGVMKSWFLEEGVK